MTLRELRNVIGCCGMNNADLIVVSETDSRNDLTLSLDYITYAKYANNEINMITQAVYTEHHSDNSMTVKPKLIIYVYEKGEQND